jgi:hypothetical protein
VRKVLLLLLLVALLALPLALAFRDISRMLLTELLRLVWLTRRQLESLPQETVWGLLLVAVLVAAVGSLFGWSRLAPGVDAGPPDLPGHVQELSRWLHRAAAGPYFRWTLHRYLSNLLWEALAHRERSTPHRLKARFRAGDLDLPPVVDECLNSDALLRPATRRGLWARLRRRPEPRPSRTPLHPALEEVIRFLEEQLEVEHDPGTG